MKTFTHFSKMKSRPLLFLVMFFLLISFRSTATHFRYGSISWQHVSGNTYQIKVAQAWRTTFYSANPNNINIGTQVNTQYPLLLGDGSQVPVILTVTSVVRPPVANDGWFYGEFIYTKTYTTTGNKVVSFQSCCRVDGLLNVVSDALGADQTSFAASTVINVGTSNNGPVSSISPIVNVQVATINKFKVPFNDPDGDVLTYRLANNTEMIGTPAGGNFGGAYTVPTGVSINPATGEVTFNTAAYPVGSLLTLGVIASDGLTSSKVDFIIQVVGQSTPPQFDYGITPALGQFYSIRPGDHLNFHINAFDTDPGSFVTLNGVGFPIGSTFLPTTAGVTSGNPLDYTFNWTPTNSQLGTYVLNITTTDNASVQTSTSIVIKVSLAPVFVVPPTPAENFLFITEPNNPVVFNVQAANPDVTDVVTLLPLPASYPAGIAYTTLPKPTPNAALSLFNWTPAVSQWGDYDFVFQATNPGGDIATHDISVLVNSIPTITSTPPGNSVIINNNYTYNFVGTDPDVPFGDELETSVSGLPGWLTFIDNGNGTATFTGAPGVSDVGTFTFTITVEDIFHHSHAPVEQTVTIVVNPCTLLAQGFTTTNVSCYGQSNGYADFNTIGGFAPFKYVWSNGDTTEIASNLAAGSYSVTVTDRFGCSAHDTVSISQPAPLVSTPSVLSHVSCFGGSDGSALVTISGGTAPYSYGWSSGSTSSTATGLTAGPYLAVTADANGCQTSIFITITQPTQLINTTSVLNNVSCFGGSNGSANVNAIGGTAPYLYVWSTGDSASTIIGLAAGTYIETTTDSKGCQFSNTVVITEPTQLTSTIVVTNNVSCFGGDNGSASVTATGGTAPYSFLWSNGSASSTITGLTAGMYTATSTDANGCQVSYTAIVSEPATLVSTPNVLSNVSCFGGSDGSASVTISGGTAPYSYGWSSGSTSATATGLTAGVYLAVIADANGCQVSSFITITQPAQLVNTASVLSNVSCFGGNNGSASVAVLGGTAPYTYLWSNGSTSETATGLTSGVYTETTTDANGCLVSSAITITQPAQLVNTASVLTHVSCFGGNNGSAKVTASGGTSPYTYLWSNGSTSATATTLTSGVYTETTTDANGCKVNSTIAIIQPTLLVNTASVLSNVSCFGGNNGSAKVTVSGGTSPYTYVWSNGSTSATATGLTAGIYTETTTDANGCKASSTITITQSIALSLSLSSPTVIGNYNTSCNPTGDGQISSAVSGGVAPYTYVWSNNSSASSISNVVAGSYTLTVTDSKGCVISKSITLSKPVNCNCAVAPTTAPSLTCATCNLVLDGLSNVVLSNGNNACIKNSFTGNISMNGGTLVICGRATVQNLAIPAGSKVVVLGSLTVNDFNMNDASSSLENFGTIDIKNNFSVNGTFINQGSFTVEGTANFNSNIAVTNYSTITVVHDLNNNKSFNNNGTLTVKGTFTNNSGSTFTNNCLASVHSLIVNDRVTFSNNGTLFVTRESRFNSATASVSGGSIFQTNDMYLNGTNVNLPGNVCALINVNATSQINQSTLNGPVSYCDANGIETKNNFQLLAGSILSCTTCKYSGSIIPSLARLADNSDAEVINAEAVYSLYPNPASKGDRLTLVSDLEIVKVDIMDSNGKFIKTQSGKEIDTNGMNSGFYVVRFTDAQNQTKTIKFLILN